MKYAEFCTGIGGFRLGIEESELNAKLVYTNEISESCLETYKRNFNDVFDSKDIFDIDPKRLPNFDLMCAGFPCQPFSQAGNQKGFLDPRGTVFFKLLEIIKEKKPKILFFENVPNLVHHNGGETFKTIKGLLEKENYIVHYQILDSKYYNVPQSRPRIYIVAFRDKKKSNKFSFTSKENCKTIPLKKVIKKNDCSIPISSKWEEYIDLYTNKKKLEDMSFVVPKTRKKLERISNGCDLNNCIFQIRSSGIRAYSLDEPFPTFAVSISGGGAMIPVLSKQRRHLCLDEMKSIMGFPKWYDLSVVSRTDAIKQLANAVCPPVITSICNDIKKAL